MKQGLKTRLRAAAGLTLVEVLIALAILSVVSVGLLSALTTSSKAAIAADQLDTGRAIALSQMEWVREQSFQSSGIYTVNESLLEDYPGYSVDISAEDAQERDSFIQTITVTVSFGDRTVATLQNCKTKR
jgi:prepilin-type N-terminal cleavage/methylation domain-containing protein